MAVTNRELLDKSNELGTQLAVFGEIVTQLKAQNTALILSINRHEEILMGDGDKKVGLVRRTEENTEFRVMLQSEAKWLRRTLYAAILVSVVGIMVGCLKLDQISTQVADNAAAVATNAEIAATVADPDVGTQPLPTPASSTPVRGNNRSGSAQEQGGIIEVTPRPTLAIVELGTPVGAPAAGIVVFEPGTYTPDSAEDVRICPALGCRSIARLSAGQAVKTQGWLLDTQRAVWLCLVAGLDSHGAQLCEEAVLYITHDGQRHGTFVPRPR